MSNESEPNQDFLAVQPQEMFVDAEGTKHTHFGMLTNMEDDRIKERLSDAYGMDPEDVIIESPDCAQKPGRTTVGFRRWNSSWNPKGDPSLN